MIVYHASKKVFVNDVFNGSIADDIDHAFLLHLGRHMENIKSLDPLLYSKLTHQKNIRIK